MSVTDPFIKELKGWTRKLTEYNKEIDDQNENLSLFCKCLERILKKGILVQLNTIGLSKVQEPWYWLLEIAKKYSSISYSFSCAVKEAKECEKVRTCTGRLRLFIRICLNRKCLHIPIEFLVRTPSLASEYYEANSILGHNILGEIFLSALMQSSKLNFKLNLQCASFLDETWELPDCVKLELVPCKTLGISVCFVKEKALIVNVDKNSVAAEDDKIEVGDVLDEINENTITSKTRGKLRKIMKKGTGQPIYLHIIKLRCAQTNDLYGPIIHLIKSSGLDYMKKLLKLPEIGKKPNEDIHTSRIDRLNAGFPVMFCGSIHIGTEGDVKQIENAMWHLFASGEPKYIPVKFECLEIGIRVTQQLDGLVICKQTYMEISSCGRTTNIPDYFAFIAGDTNCSVATNFEAFVFYHQNKEEVQTILQSLGQGFQRTHFAV